MKGYVKRRMTGLTETRKPRLFSTKGYLSDLDSMIQTQYQATLNRGIIGNKTEAMVSMLVELELKEKEK